MLPELARGLMGRGHQVELVKKIQAVIRRDRKYLVQDVL